MKKILNKYKTCCFKELIMATIILVTFGCGESNPLEYPRAPFPLYVPGEIIAVLADTVSESFFNSFVKQMKIEVLNRNYSLVEFWIEVLPDSITHTINHLLKYDIFSGVTEKDYPYQDKDTNKKYIFMFYKYGKDASDVNEGKNAIETLKLILKRIVIRERGELTVVFKVPVGLEDYWCQKLKNYNFVYSCNRNSISITH